MSKDKQTPKPAKKVQRKRGSTKTTKKKSEGSRGMTVHPIERPKTKPPKK
jgi:hypothetical protein